ncbi:MAG: RnfABCDGE type electron transport complex subunit D, partial [Gammaproteobacteria bacterium]|nr:RnfABCDGE type electron transport complex subunit D [Gammaproteobacteria bacterium]
MKPLRKFLDSIEPLFSRGGRFEKFEAIYEMVDTLFFTPADVTRGSPHVRDAIDLKRVMIMVVFAATPCALIGMWNVGFQANSAMASLGIEWIDGWRGSMLALLGAGYDPGSVYDNFIHGLLYFLPIYIVTMAAGGFWEVLFASVRNHEVNEGFFVTSFLYALILPATTPLWQVALGISFGVVIGKEVFGGTGKNFLNPALVGRAFLYFAYPVQLSGDAVWVPIDGYTGATAL